MLQNCYQKSVSSTNTTNNTNACTDSNQQNSSLDDSPCSSMDFEKYFSFDNLSKNNFFGSDLDEENDSNEFLNFNQIMEQDDISTNKSKIKIFQIIRNAHAKKEVTKIKQKLIQKRIKAKKMLLEKKNNCKIEKQIDKLKQLQEEQGATKKNFQLKQEIIKIRNRISAQKSREKKQQQLEKLLAENQELYSVINDLQSQITQLKNDNELLQQMNQQKFDNNYESNNFLTSIQIKEEENNFDNLQDYADNDQGLSFIRQDSYQNKVGLGLCFFGILLIISLCNIFDKSETFNNKQLILMEKNNIIPFDYSYRHQENLNNLQFNLNPNTLANLSSYILSNSEKIPEIKKAHKQILKDQQFQRFKYPIINFEKNSTEFCRKTQLYSEIPIN